MAVNRITPSPDALLAYIADLEKDLKDLEFNLQASYNKRLTVLDLIAAAKKQLNN